MPIAPEDVRRLLEQAGRPVGLKELLRAGEYHPGQQTDLKRVLRDLLRAQVIRKDGKRFLLPTATREGEPLTARRSGPWVERATPARAGRSEGTAPPSRSDRPSRSERSSRPSHGAPRSPREPMDSGRFLEGSLRMHREGYGFVHPSSGQGDNVFIPAFDAQRALDGDTVRVEYRGPPGRLEGRIVDVLRRRRSQAVGVYQTRGRRAWVEPQDAKLGDVIHVPPTQLAQPGDVVTVVLGVGDELVDTNGGLTGEISGSLGKPGHPSSEVLSIVFAQGFTDEFPEEVMEEAAACPSKVGARELKTGGRRDLRELPLITIDGEDARDFDDAVLAEAHPKGFRLVVAIADVTHYVREGTALDDEALRRATSVYLPDRVLPMLPERLSNGICSLRPDEDRLCMVADLVIDRAGRRLSTDLYPAVMRSAARCTYNEVQAVLDGQDVPHRMAFKPAFKQLHEVALALRGMRKQRGAIDFDLKETRIVVGEDGFPDHVELRPRLEANRLIEECMLAANEAVAHFFHGLGLPTVYRFHDEPNEVKLAAFLALAGAHGFTFAATDRTPTSVELNALLESMQGHAEQRTLNQLLLRSMMQAVYSSENVGHYGLAAEHYLHFTSPIRRYPDLLVHRLLKAHWRRKGKMQTEKAREIEEERLGQMAVQSSERERAAMQAEREVTQYYVCILMKDRVGEIFDATVASITDFGFFAELVDVHVEGIVRSDTLGPGMKLDLLHHMLIWPSGRKVRVGAKLVARLVAVNMDRRQLELEVEEFIEDDRAPAKAVVPDARDTRPRGPGRATRSEPAAARGKPGREPRGKHHAAPAATARHKVDIAPRSTTHVLEREPVRAPEAKPAFDRKGRGAPQRDAAREAPKARRGKVTREVDRTPPIAAPEPEPEPQPRERRDEADAFRSRPAFVPPGMEDVPTPGPAGHPGFDRLRALASQGPKPERPQDSRSRPGAGTRPGSGKGRPKR